MFFYYIQLKRKIYMILCCAAILSVVVFFYKEIYPPENIVRNVKADLVIPKENALLKRSEILSQIEEKNQNKEQEEIDTIGLVGDKGSGKTVLARCYGYAQHGITVWEFNAENKETLMRSFKDLAYSLALSKSEKEELIKIENISSSDLKEQSLLSFVEQGLKSKKNWLLIYDNVQNFSEISPYFPQNSKLWGAGKVILTTRDKEIKTNSDINPENIIEVGELQEEDALTLFTLILFDLLPNKLDSEKKEEALNFLRHITPLPLDIAMAARYIKNGGISYEKYLDLLDQKDPAFERTQNMFFKEASDYIK